MKKITAIHSGYDWYDASADYLILGDLDIKAEHRKWREWYNKTYLPSLSRYGDDLDYISLAEWLKIKGARTPNEQELEIYEDH